MPDVTDRPRAKSLRPLRALLPFLAPHRVILFGALAALLVAAAAMLAVPAALRQLIDNALATADTAALNRYLFGFLGASVAFGVFAALRFYLVTWMGERVVADLREAVYRRVVRMDPMFFESTRTGEVLSRLTADTTLVQAIAGVNLSITLRSILSLVGGLVMLALTSARLTGAIVILIPVVIVPMIIVGRRVRSLSRSAQDRIADTSSVVDETLNAIQTVQAFTLEELQSRRYDAAVERSFKAAISRSKVRAVLTAFGTMLVFIGIAIVLWMGARQVVVSHDMTWGQLSQFFVYALYVGIAAASLTEMWGEVQRAAGAMERLAELLEAQPSIAAPAQPASMPAKISGRIAFENISFSYPSRPETRALDDYSLEVRSGETVAFVGPSGAGKSTTFQLLLRFYDPQSGRICIDGVDIKRWRPEDLRSKIGFVPQDTVLFGASARENIDYGRPGSSNEQIVAAARAAAADEFLSQLPEGYDSFLGERGVRLSGGQRQRIAIARAILKDPPILLLDEATSSLDAESERLVQAALTVLMRGRTTLVIAHRLSTVLRADRIVVLQAGRIVAVGKHAELMRSSPLYARLAALQFNAAEEALEV
jgi:ATP-binding cassette, subfamily B, bacterial